MWAAYNIEYAGSPKSSVAVSAFEEQYINDSELAAFLSMHGLPPNSYTLIGSNNQVDHFSSATRAHICDMWQTHVTCDM